MAPQPDNLCQVRPRKRMKICYEFVKQKSTNLNKTHLIRYKSPTSSKPLLIPISLTPHKF